MQDQELALATGPDNGREFLRLRGAIPFSYYDAVAALGHVAGHSLMEEAVALKATKAEV